MIREQGDLLSQYIVSHLFTHGAIYSLWMASLPQDQKFRGEKASHSPSLLGTYRLVRISNHQLSLRLTMCKVLHEQIMFIIFLTTLWWQYYLTEEEIKAQKWQKKKKKTKPAQGHRAHKWQTWVLNPKTTLLPTLQHHFLLLEQFLGKNKTEEPWWLK